jgi:cell division septation protein DedD
VRRLIVGLLLLPLSSSLWAEGAPVFTPVPSPSAAQTQQSEPADLFNGNGSSAIQTWLIPVGSKQSVVQAQALVNSLQSQGYNAFLKTTASDAQVYIGPEASHTRVADIVSKLKQQSLQIGEPIIYQPLDQ